LYLQVRNNENMSENPRIKKKINWEKIMTTLTKFGKMHKFWSIESRLELQVLSRGLGVFDEVSVSNFKPGLGFDYIP